MYRIMSYQFDFASMSHTVYAVTKKTYKTLKGAMLAARRAGADFVRLDTDAYVIDYPVE